MAPRVWNDSEKLVLLKTVLLTLGSPKINGELVAEKWIGDGPAPSARMIRDTYNGLLRVTKEEASLKAMKSEAKSEDAVTKTEHDCKPLLATPESKIATLVPSSSSTRPTSNVRSGQSKGKGTKTSGKKRKRSKGSESEEEAASVTTDSDDNIATPSKRVLPIRRTRTSAKVIDKSGLSEDDDFKDDAAKDFGGVGSDAEYGAESE